MELGSGVVIRQDVLEPDFLKLDFGNLGLIVGICDFLAGQGAGIELYIIQIAADCIQETGGQPFALAVTAHNQGPVLGMSNLRTGRNGPGGHQFAVQVQLHVAALCIEGGSHMVPLILLQIVAVGPDAEPLVTDAHLEGKAAVALVAQNKAPVLLLAALTNNGSEVVIAVIRSIGIVPFKGSGSNPRTDSQRRAGDLDVILVIGDVPKEAYDLVSAIKDAVDLPIDLHTHSTTGLAFMTYLKAVEAGCDIIDTAISPFSGGTSQPATETMAYALRQLGYEVNLNDEATTAMADYFKGVRDEYVADGTLMAKALATDTQCLTYQVPGGMLSNLMSQLKQMNALDKFEEALLETPRVRADMGYPPLVTPTSQMVGVQAVRNVIDGERYKTVSKEIKAYCRGEYGTTPAPIDPAIKASILGDEKPLEGRFADTLPPIVDDTRKKLEGVARCDEDVLSYIAFPNLAEKFFEYRKAKEENEVVYSIEEM